jgi:sodium/potassium-transporting ATPase subunit alpha
MTCYGFPFNNYYELLSKNAFMRTNGQFYDTVITGAYSFPSSPLPGVNFNTLGFDPSFYQNQNCAYSQANGYISKGNNYPDWVTGANGHLDLRAVYVTCCGSNNIDYCPQWTWPSSNDVVHSISPTTKVEVAFTTEAVFYAQSGYFVTIVMVQWSNVFACKSRKVPIVSCR